MELLFAIFIFAIVISSVYGAYRATFHIVHNSEAEVRVAHYGRVAVSRVSDDLQSLVTGTGGFLRGEQHEFDGKRGDSLSFVSSAHIALRKQDIASGDAFIRYSVEPDSQNGLLNMYRSDTLMRPGTEIGEEEVEKHLICSGASGIRFSYIDSEGGENEEWISSEGLLKEQEGEENAAVFPLMINIELRFADTMEGDSLTVFKTAVALPQRSGK